MNENVLGAKSGDTSLVIEVDLDGFSFGGLSDFVMEGRYLLKATEAAPVQAKDGIGMNMRVSWQIVGPDCSEKGKTVVVHHPIQPGPKDDPEVKKRNFYIKAMTASIYSMAGKFGDNMGLKKISGEWIKGKVAAGYIVEERTPQGQEVGALKSYLAKDTYEANAGPATVKASASNVTTGKPPQTPSSKLAAEKAELAAAAEKAATERVKAEAAAETPAAAETKAADSGGLDDFLEV
jgi:hypothetical protein